jgi:phage baseplate assembly protein gpV
MAKVSTNFRQRAQFCNQHFTVPDIGEVGLLALAKAGEHAALLVHVFDANSGTAPVGPLGPP